MCVRAKHNRAEMAEFQQPECECELVLGGQLGTRSGQRTVFAVCGDWEIR